MPTIDAAQLEKATAEEILAVALKEFGPRFGIATSFQSEGQVLAHMATRIDPKARIFTLDTGRLPAETYDLMATLRSDHGINVEIVYPDAAETESMTTLFGINNFRDSSAQRKLCCQVRKVHPMNRKLAGMDAYAVGLRRSQSSERADVPKAAMDGAKWKFSPLADWTFEQIEAYLEQHGVPEHPLVAKGFVSIGCAPCTRAIAPGEPERAGRWWWETDAGKECGLHATPDGQLKRELDVLLDQVRAARPL
jgi:phosphoadenylyl-sulfate reductase (thioredoxin)